MMKTKSSPIARPENPWDVRLGWFWYNDEEIYHDSDADLDRKAKMMADNNINLATTFSCTHFRWSFYPYWDQINDVLTRIVQAFHNHNIQVVEHHSAVLTHAITDEASKEWLERCLQSRHSTSSSWPELIGTPEKQDPIIIDNQRLSSFYQIKGETGKPMKSGYHGHIICVNNPYYQRAYLSYLQSVYATGVDGIMTDDVAYTWHGCVCEHCRRKFKQWSGYDIPSAGAEWEKWLGNTENPAFRAFIDFKRKSVENFHIMVKKHYENLGLRLLRPNYHAHCFHNYRAGYCMQKLPALDYVFQEAGGAHIMEYSWPSWGPEVAHRFSVGRFRSIPSMLMTYPTRESNLILSWALAMSWGQSYTWTNELGEPPAGEQKLRNFELKHKKLLQKPEKYASLAFYDSHRAREMNFEYKENVHPQLLCWTMACSMSNTPYDILSQEELTERLSAHSLIVLVGVKYLSNWELAEFKHFLANGGTIIWTGQTGRFDCANQAYSEADIAAALNCPEFIFPEASADFREYSADNGRLLTCGEDHLVAGYEPEYHINWLSQDLNKDITTPFKQLTDDDLLVRKSIVKMLGQLLPTGPDLVCQDLPEGVLATTFINADHNAVVVHLVNASGILDKEDGSPLSYYDEDSVPFPSHAGKPPISVTIKLPTTVTDFNQENIKCLYHDLNDDTSSSLSTKMLDGSISISLPADMLKAYGLIEIQKG